MSLSNLLKLESSCKYFLKCAHFQIEEIVKDFGLVVCNRVGYDLDKYIYEFDVLTSHKVNFISIHEFCSSGTTFYLNRIIF